MRASVIRIGNSRGVRIPRTVLEECGIESEVDLKVEKRRIILEPVRSKPRSGWAEEFREMHERGDDHLLIPDGVDADLKDWKW